MTTNRAAVERTRDWHVARLWAAWAIPTTLLASLFLGHGTIPIFALYSPWAALIAVAGGGATSAVAAALLQLPAYGAILQYAAWHHRLSVAAVLLAALHTVGAYTAFGAVRAYLG
jgi:hypothetical protein